MTVLTHLLAFMAGAALVALWSPPARSIRNPKIPDHTHNSRGRPRLRLETYNGVTLVRSPRRGGL